MRVVIATDSDFWLEGQGSRARIAAIVRYLAKRGDSVAVFYTRRLKPVDERVLRERFPHIHVEEVSLPQPVESGEGRPLDAKSANPGTILGRIAKRVSGAQERVPKVLRHADKKLSEFRSEFHIERFREFCARFDPDAAIVVFIRLSSLAEAWQDRRGPRPVTFIDTIDVMHLRTQRFHANNEPHWVDISREEEADALRRFDVIVAIQDRDAAVFREMLPGARVIVVGHPVPIVEHFDTGGDVVRLGYIASAGVPNRKAIESFLGDAWPAIRRAHGGRVELRVAGAICDSISRDVPREGLTLLGFIDDTARFYAETDIVVNPVTFGGGLKIKCVEALCHGMPLVTTAVGAEGIESGAGTAYLLAEDMGTFVDAVNSLVVSRESRTRLSKGALEFARRQFSEESAFGALISAMQGD
jgi:glycosyltransferase involved in cell wall biosynthesis